MLFDVSLVTSRELVLLLSSFFVTYVLLCGLRLLSWPLLRVAHTSSLRYAGLVLAVVTSGLALLVLPNTWPAMGLVVSTLVIILGGYYDEKYKLSPLRQLLFQASAVGIVIFFGWTIIHVSNPFSSGVILFTSGVASVLTFIWLMLIINALNLFDGVDGTAGTVSVVSFAMLALISLLPATQDLTTFTLSMIGLGVSGAFLLGNWWPARWYLGTIGSWWLGLYIGLVAIVGGGKIATTLLVLAVPLIDVFLVVIQRIRDKRFPWKGDKKRHFHFRLLQAGFSPRQISILVGLISLFGGLAALVLQTYAKLWLFAFIALSMILIVAYLIIHYDTASQKDHT